VAAIKGGYHSLEVRPWSAVCVPCRLCALSAKSKVTNFRPALRKHVTVFLTRRVQCGVCAKCSVELGAPLLRAGNEVRQIKGAIPRVEI